MIFARLRKETGDLDDKRRGDGTGIRGDGARWLLGGASVGVAVEDRAVLSVVVRIPGRSNGVANGVRTSVVQSRGRKRRWDDGDSVCLSVSRTWVDQHRGVRLLAALVETAPRTLQTALGPRSGSAVVGGHQAVDDSVGCLACEATGSICRNGVANDVGTSIGRLCGQDRGRQGANNRVGRSTLGHGSIGIRALVRTSVGRSCGRKQRRYSGDSVG